MNDARTGLIAALRHRFAAYQTMSQQERDVLDATRLIPIKETEELFEKAMNGDDMTALLRPGRRILTIWSTNQERRRLAVADNIVQRLRRAALSGDMPLGQSFDCAAVADEIERLWLAGDALAEAVAYAGDSCDADSLAAWREARRG